MAIIWGLAAALAFGFADFAAREAGEREGSLRALLYVQLVGGPIALAIALFSPDVSWTRLLSMSGLYALFVGIEFAIGNVLLYRALVTGPLLVVAPVTSSYAIVTVILALVMGENLSTSQLVGITVTITGIILCTTATVNITHSGPEARFEGLRRYASSGMAAAIAAALLLGIGIWLLQGVIYELGSQLTVVTLRLTATTVLGFIFWISKQSTRLSSHSSLRWMLLVGILDTVATLFLSLGLNTGLSSVVAVITSLYSVVTVILGYVLLRERLSMMQQVGIGITLIGVALTSG